MKFSKPLVSRFSFAFQSWLPGALLGWLLAAALLPFAVLSAEPVEITGQVAVRAVNCYNPEPHEHHADLEYFVVDEKSGEQFRLILSSAQMELLRPMQRVQVSGFKASESAGATGDATDAGKLNWPEKNGHDEVEAVAIEILPAPARAGAAEREIAEGANDLTLLSTLLVFISTDTHGCMTSESNARGRLFDNATNANEGMQAVTKGRYGLQLGNGTGVPQDHVIDLTLNVNSANHDTDSIELLVRDALFDPAPDGLGLNRYAYHRILMFAPDGIQDKGFTAWAYVANPDQLRSGMISMYGRNYGNNYLNGYLHELGHSFGFMHSTKPNTSNQYRDRTCVMGLSNDGTRTETYNAVKLMSTDWLDAFPGAAQTLTQDATVDLYPLSSDLTAIEETVAVSISGTDYYLAYHRNDLPYGHLSQSGDRDKVFVYTNTNFNSLSYQQANLAEGDQFDGSITVQFGAYGAGNAYATVSIDVADGNTMPTVPEVWSTGQNQDVVMNFPTTDADGDSISYATLENPSNGTLSGSYPNLTYTPDTDYVGSDTFRITASDALISNFITVTVEILMVNENEPTVDAGEDQSTTLGDGAAWTPAQITTAAWYDASDASTLTESGGAVSEWRDKSGLDRHLTSTSSREPTTGSVTINGTNALDFTNDEMATTGNPFAPAVSDALVIAVHKVDNDGNRGTMFSLTGSDAGGSRWQSHAPYSGTAYFDCGGTSPPSRINTNYGTDTGDNVLVGFYGSTTDNVQQIYKNGSLLVGDTSGHSVSTVGDIVIGSGSGRSYQDTSIGELIIINGTVSVEDRQKLEGYLAHKWGLAANLPAGHPYQAAPPGGAGASVELAGSASDLDNNPLTTTWTQVSGSGSVSFSDASALDATAYFSEADTYVLRLTADDGVFQSSDDITITVTTYTQSEAWRYGYFGQTDSSGDAADENDFDGDGISNLLERAFGTSPIDSASSVPMPQGEVMDDSGSDYMTLTYRRLVGGSGTTGVDYTVDGLTYTVEYDEDLTPPWSEGGVLPVGDPVDHGDGTESVTVRLSDDLSQADQQFMRLRVTAAP